jgi:hypothetical protein
MTRPIIRIHNVETDEVIDREMTVNEYEIAEASQAAQAAELAEAEAKAAEKEALLERLGITAEEAKLLLS